MEKRGRGRPRKIQSPISVQERLNVSNGKVTHSDLLPEFFKIYIPDLCSDIMKIPPDFINNFGGNIPTKCNLKRPSGVSWQVDMTRMNDLWFFQNGWPEFVQENSIKDHDVLTFCLVGKSTFFVKTFSPNGCMKGGDTSMSDESENSETNETSRRIVRRRTG